MKKGRVFGWIAAAGGAALTIAGAVAVLGAGCTSAPSPIPLRTFERPQKLAAVCLNILAEDSGEATTITPLPLGACPPVPFNANGAPFPNHLFALVTQQTRGQLALVDLTNGNVLDEDRSTPGINFIPVGANPSDVAVSPDFDPTLTFVSSRDPNSFAIYALDNARLTGDAFLTTQPQAPLTLPDLRVCSLPQPPMAMGIVTLPQTASGPAYAIAAILGSWAGAPPQIVTVDPRPFADAPAAGITQLQPGVLQPCVLLGTTTLAGASAVPQAWTSGPAWPDGVPYADAGAPLPMPPLGPTAACLAGGGDSGAPASGGPVTVDAGPAIPPLTNPLPMAIAVRNDAPVAYVADAALPLIHILDLSGGGSPVEVGQYFATSLANTAMAVPVAGIALSPVTRDQRRYLYAIDGNDGSLMVFDATSPTPPATPATPLVRPHAELNPLAPADRLVFAAPVAALAFATHDWPYVPLNALSPAAYTGVLCDPNPNALVDGGGAFVDGGIGGFYRADEAVQIQPQGSGVAGFPSRLRGVFAFATLSNGSMVTIDVDDWDAPCRRPDPMGAPGLADGGAFGNGRPGELALPEPAPTGPDDLDPYHAPTTTIPTYLTTGVTEEGFFPVSAPNRMRSEFLLRNDPTTGAHLPYVVAVPQLFDSTGAPFSLPSGAPVILPTALPDGFVDPSQVANPTVPNPATFVAANISLQSSFGQDLDAGPLFPSKTPVPGVRVSYDDPTVHVDEDWTVTFEGTLPTATSVVANLSSNDQYQTLILDPGPASGDASVSNGARFCSRGIEDWNVGKARVSAVSADASLALAPGQASYTADYVELTDDLLAPNDPYWKLGLVEGDDCWDVPVPPDQTGNPVDLSSPADGGLVSDGTAAQRYNLCLQTFGGASTADTTYSRDFPILVATDNTLQVGRFGWPDGVPEDPTNRTIVPADPGNVSFLKVAACCFHRQAGFKVRAGGEWLATAHPNVGLLHHVGTNPTTGECEVRCDDPTRALLNSRAFEVQTPGMPPPEADGGVTGSTTESCAGMPPQGLLPAIGRNSPFAMRNPFFSFVMWSGCNRTTTRTPRDAQWRFSLKGGFVPSSVNLPGPTGVPVAPESMLFIPPFGQMAVVDGADQGLVIIDLNTLSQAHSPYF